MSLNLPHSMTMHMTFQPVQHHPAGELKICIVSKVNLVTIAKCFAVTEGVQEHLLQ